MNRCTHIAQTDYPVTPVAHLRNLCCFAFAATLLMVSSAWAQDKQSPTAQLVQRIEQLEEQVVDMQVMIGTLQSLPRATSTTAAPAPGGLSSGGASDSARLDGMETQIRALTAQLAQLSQQIRTQNSGTGDRRGALGTPDSQSPATVAANPGPQTGAITGFGSTTVLTQDGAATTDPISGYLQAPATQELPPAARQTAVVADRSNPKKQYEAAYGYLLQQQYSAAQTAFSDFVSAHPDDPLAGNAQYWLGETFFLRQQYKSAASAFLKGYETFATSSKAPDSLLKLAMSLDRLGHKDAACSSLSELNTRFPGAPAHVKKRAVNERKRVGC